MNSYLTAVVLLIAAAIQADAFTGSMPLTGVRSPASQRGVFKMELSPYEEYMASRGQSVAPPAPAAPVVSAPSAPARVSSPKSSSPATANGKWQPRDKPSWKSSPSPPSPPASRSYSRQAVSSPSAPKVSSPSAPAAYTPPPPAPSARAAPPAAAKASKTGAGHVGSGGMADTRDPEPVNHEDPRKSISAAPSFEEYLKSRG